MRNLFVSRRRRLSGEGKVCDASNIHTAYDTLSRRLYICATFLSQEPRFFSHSGRLHETVAEIDADFDEPVVGGVVSFDFVQSFEGSRLVLVTKSAQLFQASTAMEFRLVGQMASGKVLAASWNPERTLLAIIEDGNKLSILSSTFDSIRESTCIMEDKGRSGELVDVGWGKKETQFHGTLGKQAALKREAVGEGLLGSDDRQASIAWHPDGAFLACSIVFESDSGAIRKIFVYEQTGTCYSISEPVRGLEGSALAWKPNGELIAAVQQDGDKRRIIFFERNGLRHGEHDIADKAVRRIQWNSDSSIMSVCFQDNTVQLWTMGNYHYYLKQEFLRISWAEFDIEDPRLLYTCSSCKGLERYELDWRVDSHEGLVAVIDGAKLLLTLLPLSNLPPPLCHGEIELSRTPSGVTVFRDVREWVLTVRSCNDEWEQARVTIDLHGVTVLARESLGTQRMCVDEETDPGPLCPWLDTKDGHSFGLTPEGRMFVDGDVLLSNCTSFLLTDEFLVLTTSDHWLRFFPFAGISTWHSTPMPTDQNYSEELGRKVERGARLVVILPSTAAVILQMPRGNLETIYPRAMVLSSVRRYLDALEYLSAYLLCRRHRVDLNIIHDHKPLLFISTIGKFVADVGGRDVEYLNLFLAALNEHDVTQTRYRGFKAQSSTSTKNKIEIIADKIRSACSEKGQTFINVTITSYAVQKRYEDALGCIAAEGGSSLMEKSLKYLLFLVNPETLYNVALGMYNLPLALSIARRSSQLDPKEYNALIEELARLPELTRRFKIDDMLKRHGKALSHMYESIPRMATEEEWLGYMRKHNVYLEASKLLSRDTPLYKTVMCLYGEHLVKHGDISSAIVSFRLAEEKDRIVLLCREHCEFWRESIAIDPTEAHGLIESLRKKKMGADAFHLARFYVKDMQLALELAIEESLWDELRGFGSISNVRSHVEAEFSRLSNELGAIDVDLRGKGERLEAAQEALLRRITSEISSPAAGSSADVADNMSELSFSTATSAHTGISAMSGITRLSTKSRKKADRQRLRDKPGSKHEREFLHHATTELVMKIGLISEELGSFLKILLDHRMVDEARKLQSQMQSIEKWLADYIPRFNASELSNKEAFDLTHPVVQAYMSGVPLCLQLAMPASRPYALPLLG